MPSPTRTLDGQVDRLYQLPLDEFTEARNALAKELGKEGGGEVRKLQKPPTPAWAVNQLYWSRRKTYDALVAAASAMRHAHAQVLAGKRADLRAAGTAHEEALDEAVKNTIEILTNAGQPPTDATKQAVINTLRALPATGEAPGRLARTLMPGGFELLAGLPIAGGKRVPVKLPPPPREPVSTQPRDKGEQRARALAKAKEAVAEAQRIEKSAEQQSRREEFEAARTARDAERASQKAADARDVLEAAQSAADEADTVSEAANRKKDAAARRAREAADALARARVKTETAQAELARLQS
jgi:hypothetical protein